MIIPKHIKVIAFDADDTLWVNEMRFRELEKEFVHMMTDFVDEKTCRNALFQTELRNMEFYGYGVKPFVLSVIETGIELSSLCKKTPNIALLSFLKQSITKVNSLVSETSKALSLTFSYQRLKNISFLVGTKYGTNSTAKHCNAYQVREADFKCSD
ncbi:MAG: hypothetical protein U9N51_10225 [Bacteroidota bacterium]|nr:hypothetical protein [Bacteroidota bacterium]